MPQLVLKIGIVDKYTPGLLVASTVLLECLMSSILHSYLKHSTKCKNRAERVELVQNLLAELLEQVSVSGDRSPAEALETVKACDRVFRDFAKHPSTFHTFKLSPFGFRGALVTGYDENNTAVLFAGLGWDVVAARHEPAPWEVIP